MDGLIQAALKGKGVDLDEFRAQVQDEKVGSRRVFELVADVSEKVSPSIRTLPDMETLFRDIMCGVVIKVFIQGAEAGTNLLVDLKTGPEPMIRCNTGDDLKYDVGLTFASEEQFRGSLSKRIDVKKLFKLGQIKVSGSLRSKMKLMPLSDIGRRLEIESQKRLNREAMSTLDWETVPCEGRFTGTLEKKSDWLKSWNRRYFTLEWDSYNRPTLTYADSANTTPRASFELHSACIVEPRITTRKDKKHHAAFAIFDRRAKLDIIVVCAATDEVRSEWMTKIKGAISARTRSRAPQREFALADDATKTHEEPPEIPDENDKVVQESQRDVLEALLVSTGVESHVMFCLRKLNWRCVPIAVVLALVLRRAGDILSRLLRGSFFKRVVGLGISALLSKVLFTTPYFELLRRRLTVYTLAIRMIADLKLTDLKSAELPPIHADAVWKTKQRSAAEMMYYHSLRLGGLWVKVAQHLGARPDVFPATVTDVLGRLQDEVPPTEFSVLQPFLRQELGGQDISEVFSSFDEVPFAAASIGQVHLATLRSDGTKVVVKVQHPGIEKKLTQDVYNMGVIASWVALVDRKLDLGPILEQWGENVLKELDFLIELENMQQVGSNFVNKHPPAYATVPYAINDLCTKRMLVMRYVQGAKITNPSALRDIGITGIHSKRILADDIVESFAHQMFIGGTFNADPHPGNIIVARREDIQDNQVVCIPENVSNESSPRPVPVLLDFGLSLHLPENIRLGLAKLIFAGSQLDAGGVMQASKDIGIVVSRENLLEDVSGLQHLLRDTSPPDQSRKETLERIEVEKEKFQRSDYENPVESFPPELLLFFRSLNLVRGVCSSLGVRQPFIKTLALWAKRALIAEHPVHDKPSHEPPTADKPSLSSRLRAVLDQHQDLFHGCQISVREGPAQIVSIATGTLSETDSRPVSNQTQFPLLSQGQSIMQVLAHLALHMIGFNAKDNKLHDLLDDAGNENFSLRDILCGDFSRLPVDASKVPENFSSRNAANWQDNFAFVCAQLKACDPKETKSNLPFEFSHASFFWGWLVALLVERACSRTSATGSEPELSKIVSNYSFRLGFPSAEAAKKSTRDGEIAQVSFPVQTFLEQRGIDDLGSMVSQGGAKGDTQMLGMVSDVIPSLKGKEFWVDPRMVNFENVLAACAPTATMLGSAPNVSRFFHALGNNGVCGEERLFPGPVTANVLDLAEEISRIDKDPLAENFGGLRNFVYFKANTEIKAYGQISFGGNVVITIPSLSVTVCVLVNSLSIDRKLTQSLLDAIYEEYGICPEGEF